MKYLGLKHEGDKLYLWVDDFIIEPKSNSHMEVFCAVDDFYNDVEAGKIPEDLNILAERLEGTLRRPTLTEKIERANERRQTFPTSQQTERPPLKVIKGGLDR